MWARQHWNLSCHKYKSSETRTPHLAFMVEKTSLPNPIETKSKTFRREICNWKESSPVFGQISTTFSESTTWSQELKMLQSFDKLRPKDFYGSNRELKFWTNLERCTLIMSSNQLISFKGGSSRQSDFKDIKEERCFQDREDNKAMAT